MKDGGHLGDDALAALVIGTLHGDARRRADAHLGAGCPRCLELQAAYARILSVARADRSVDPPPHVVARAIRIMPAPRPDPSMPGPLWRHLRAIPLFDTCRERASPAGVRGASDGGRQVLYGVEELELEIDIQVRHPSQTPGIVDIFGQLFPRDEDPASVAELPVELICANGAVKTTTSSLGAFHIREAAYAELLVVRADDCLIAIPVPMP